MRKVLIVLLIALCGCNRLQSGEVVSKIHTPGYLKPEYDYNYATRTYMMRMVWEPDNYVIELKGVYNGHVIVEENEVLPDVFDSLKVGDCYHVAN